MNASVYSFNKHSFSTCVGQALGDAEERERDSCVLEFTDGEKGRARKDTYNYK